MACRTGFDCLSVINVISIVKLKDEKGGKTEKTRLGFGCKLLCLIERFCQKNDVRPNSIVMVLLGNGVLLWYL